jgi:transcriptional regulator with XRE-family HTH domain
MIRLNKKEKQTMGARLKAARDVAGLGLRDVACKLGTSTSTVQGWEEGAFPGPAFRAQLAELYGRPQEVLFAEYFTRLARLEALLETAV